MTDLIDRDALLADIDAAVVFSGRPGIQFAEICGANKIIERIKSAPAVDAVPIDELLELRDKLYETDRITMNGLKMLNELIIKYDGGRKEDG